MIKIKNMGKTGKSTWIGKSGIVYDFIDYKLDTIFNDIQGNYIFSRREENILCPVYIGEGMIKERIAFRINEGKIQEKGCDCVSVRLLDKGDDSKQIEEDLLAAYPSSYEPNGCNIKQGG
jgi:hypothetical protein